MKLQFVRISRGYSDPKNWFESYITDDLDVYECRSETWSQESRWVSKTNYHGNVSLSKDKPDPTLDYARRQALLSLPGGAWLAYHDDGAAQVVNAGLENCILPDLLPTVANYLAAYTMFSLPEPANDVHLCVAREFDFTNMTTDVTPESIAKCRRDYDQWYIGETGRASCIRDTETWKIVGRSDITFEYYHNHGWMVSDNETTYTTQCSHLHSLLLSLRRSQILRKMWDDVDLPNKDEAEFEGFRRAFGL